jgi:hypothetical protein
LDRFLAARTALQLLSHTGQAERHRRVDQACDPDYWRSLAPDLALGSDITNDGVEIAHADVHPAIMAAGFAVSGYFCASSMFDPGLVGRMKTAVETVREQGWPIAFAFVYDAFWILPRSHRLSAVVSAILGSGHRQTANVWAHRVAVDSHPAGWAPHADNPGLEGRLSVWISLSAATLDNGCMYVVPKDRTPEGFVQKMAVENVDRFEASDVYAVIHGCRALPTPPGAVLGWDGNTVHWGSIFRSGEPRVSISLQFLASSRGSTKYERPLLDPVGELPGFGQRLAIVAKAITDYQHFEPDGEAVRLAKAIRERFPG